MQKAPRPTQAAGRYWRGKPVAEAEAASSGSDSEEEQVDARGIKKTLTEAELAKREGFVIKNDFDLTVKEEETPETALKPQTTIKLESSEDETDSQASEDSSSEEASSEEEEVAKPLYKPVFVSKRNRDPTVVKKLTQDEEELAEIERQAQLEEQRQQAHLMVGETIKRQIASKAVEDKFPDVDDRDGLDPQSEFEAWKLRELQRIKRDADARYAREKEREEIEQRRALPEDVRLKEDLEHAQKTREGKPKQQHAFLQKYHHKGVFYTEEEILQRDYSGQVEDQVVDVKSLPSIMQVRDYGKRSRSKHTHLLDVDTSKADAGWGPKALGRKFGDAGFASTSGGSRACFNCGQDGHVSKDCPMPRKDRPEASGSSSRACYNCGKDGHVSKDCSEPRKPRPRDGDGRREQDDGYRRRADWGAHKDVRPEARRRPSRSRSRSPRGERDSRRPRSRSPSPGRDRDRDRDKRRRYD